MSPLMRDGKCIVSCHMVVIMASIQQVDSKLSKENRVVVPRQVRDALGIGSGDRVVFLLDGDGSVRVSTPRLMAMAVWARNTGGDVGDSTADLRQQRNADQAAAEAKFARIAATQQADERTEDEIADQLMAALGLP
ncbi:MAG: hypothetical protein QG597_5025 [Actinomycetota bacterium]|nr:hypothetical protein [Actinomycetota bacterium]